MNVGTSSSNSLLFVYIEAIFVSSVGTEGKREKMFALQHCSSENSTNDKSCILLNLPFQFIIFSMQSVHLINFYLPFYLPEILTNDARRMQYVS